MAGDSSLDVAMSLVRAVAVSRGMGSSELLDCARSGRKFLYGSPVFKRVLESAGTAIGEKQDGKH